MHDAYFAERGLISSGRFCEIGFDALERDPLDVIRSVYEGLDLAGFKSLQPDLKGYLSSIAAYKKNRHADLPGALRDRIAQEWRRSFEAWGYDR
jgi:hypothetical protein